MNPISQDDSPLNRKVVIKLIESVKSGPLKNARLLEADDGTSAVETLRQELSDGRQVHFVLMDYVMVGGPNLRLLWTVLLHMIPISIYHRLDQHAWAGGCKHHAAEAVLHRQHNRSTSSVLSYHLAVVILACASSYLAITGNALPDDMARFIASGANEVVTKPLTKMKLMAALDRYLKP